MQNNHGWTALLAAAKRDNRELVEALLSLGANLHIANDLQRVSDAKREIVKGLVVEPIKTQRWVYVQLVV